MASRKGIRLKKIDTLAGYARELKQALKDEMSATMDRFAADVEADFQSTVRTWNNKPTFKLVKKYTLDTYSAEVGTTDRIYKFINDGTSVRYATMTADFSPKTSPGQLAAVAGSGGLAYVNVFRPHEGIKPRAFDTQVLEKNRRGFSIRFGQALSRWAKQFEV